MLLALMFKPLRSSSSTSGQSYIKDVKDEVFGPLVQSGKLRATTDFSAIGELDTIDICVPTPLRKTKDPDMSYVVSARDAIAQYLHPGLLVMLESTTYPGHYGRAGSAEAAEQLDCEVGEDFFLCFSPERVDPGNPKFQTRNIPKVVGGITATCTEIGALFYQQALETVIPVSSTRVAEMVKLLENTFRMINIGLVNEMALMCDRMGIDVWEVIDAAATKPFRFHAVLPGSGAGRPLHSDRSFLSFLEEQGGRHRGSFYRTCRLYQRTDAGTCGRSDSGRAERSRPNLSAGSHVHLLGVAYKRDIDDVRESPALDIIHLLQRRGAMVTYSDPFVSQIKVDGLDLSLRTLWRHRRRRTAL